MLYNATWHVQTWQLPWRDGETMLNIRVHAGQEVQGWVPVIWAGGSGIARADQVKRDA